MADRIRFHLDEHIDPDIALALRRHGVDVTTTADAGLLTSDDDDQLAYVCQQRRVMVTDDADFLRMAGARSHPGIVVAHRRSNSMGEIIRALVLVYEVLTPEEMSQHIEFL